MPATPERSDLAGAHVLVLVDNDDEAEMLGRLLAARGAEVDLVNDVASAVGHLPGSGVTAVVLSLQLGRIGGLGALSEIRRHDDVAAAATPVVLLTDGPDALDERRARAAGADALLAKVFDVDELAAAIVRVSGRRGARSRS